jgi:hypothetical protein
MKNKIFLLTGFLLISVKGLCQDIKIHFSEAQGAIRQYEVMGVHDDVLYVRGMGANLHKFDVKTGAKISTGNFADKKSKGKYLTADQLQVTMTDYAIYTLFFKKAGSRYEMCMGKYDFNEQAIIADKVIDGDLVNSSYYSIEETFVHLVYANKKLFVSLYNLDGDDKTLCAYILDEDLNLLGNKKVPLPKGKVKQGFDQLVATDEGDLWLIRDLREYNKNGIFYFDIAYTKIHSAPSDLEFYRFAGDMSDVDNFTYDNYNYHPLSVNFHTYKNNLVMGNSYSNQGYYVWLNEENQNSEKEVALGPSDEAKVLPGTDNQALILTLAGVTKSGSTIFSITGNCNGKPIGYIEEYGLDGKTRAFKSTYREYGYNNSNTYVHVNKEGNYVLSLTYLNNNLKAVKIDLISGKEIVTDIPNLPNIPYLSCKIVNSGNYYAGYWFTDNLATTGGVFVVEVK